MKQAISMGFPVWTTFVAGCFSCFALGVSNFGFYDELYHELSGWIVFSLMSLANGILALALRAAYRVLRFALWVLLATGAAFFALEDFSFRMAILSVVLGNLVVLGLGMAEVIFALRMRHGAQV